MADVTPFASKRGVEGLGAQPLVRTLARGFVGVALAGAIGMLIGGRTVDSSSYSLPAVVLIETSVPASTYTIQSHMLRAVRIDSAGGAAIAATANHSGWPTRSRVGTAN